MQPGLIRHLLWVVPTALLVLTLVAGSGGLLLLYQQNHQLTSERDAREVEVKHLRSSVDSQAADIQSLHSRVSALEAQNSNLQDQAAHPTVVIWNVSQELRNASDYLVGGVPDAFTYHLKLTSTAPISVAIVSFAEFAKAADCVRQGQGSTHVCMQRAPGKHWDGITNLTEDFHEAEGCAAYVSVITAAAPATVTPNVSVTYNPASKATGTCAS